MATVAETRRRIESRNPAHLDDLVAEVPLSDPEGFTEACRAARAAQHEWESVPAPVRGGVIKNLGRLVEQNKEALSRLVTREIGKPYSESLGEVQEVVDTCDFFLSEGRRLYGQTVPSEMPDKQLFTFRTPVGVVAVITAGNFPVAVPSWYLVPAILCGNAVVWTPADYAPALGEALTSLFHAAGVPEGVLGLVQADGETTFGGLERALEEGVLDKVGFTGSSAVGREIGALCGRHLQSPCLELGGKNPLVVMPDEFLARFTRAVEEAPVGDPMREVLYGPMIHERFHERFLGWLDLIRDHHTVSGSTGTGRITAANPRKGFLGDPEAGLYCHPTIVDGVMADDDLYSTETFGPIVGVASVGSLDEGIELANGHGYGLSASIYTSSPKHAFRFRERVSAGMVSVNNSTSGAEAHLPFGGNGKSGNGSRLSGIWVLDQFTRWQSLNWDYSGKLQKAQMDVAEVDADLGYKLDWDRPAPGSP